MTAEAIRVQVEDGLRLAGTLLAASTWPEQEQARRPYKPHRVAEGARREMAALRGHPAVRAAQDIAGGPGEAGLQRLFVAAFTGQWPSEIEPHLAGFAAEAQLENLRGLAQADWEQALADLSAVMGRADLGSFVARLLGSGVPAITVFPNLLYPGLEQVTALTERGWLLVQPPPPAWGTSPPWRYSERPDEVLAAVTEALARAIFAEGLPENQAGLRAQAGLAGLAAAVLFLREAEGPEAADQFMMMAKRARKQPGLAGAVAALEGRQGRGEWIEALLRLGDGI